MAVHSQTMKAFTVRNILVPIDFSDLSILAIETAKSLARRFGATIHLAHIHDFSYPFGLFEPGLSIPMAMLTFRDDSLKRRTGDLRAMAAKHGISAAACHIRSGMPVFDQVCKVARRIHADCIVTPTHGYTGMDHFFEGSTAERIVQHSPCPVFVTKPRKGSSGSSKLGAIDKILVPVDFSGCSLDALKYAIQFAEEFTAKIVVFNAVHLGYAYTSDGYAMYDLSGLEKGLRKDADRNMREFLRYAKFGRVKFETAITVGPPISEICAFAERQNVDLIITATHGLTGFKHVLVGSTAEQLVRRAPVPVFVVPSHPEVRTKQLSRTPPARQKTSGPQRRGTAGKQKRIASELLTKRSRKRVAHPFPGRRKASKFRESHKIV
jgi:nucleotide-binding universal stress UspA family protein